MNNVIVNYNENTASKTTKEMVDYCNKMKSNIPANMAFGIECFPDKMEVSSGLLLKINISNSEIDIVSEFNENNYRTIIEPIILKLEKSYMNSI